jgi:hypothetical protein
VGAQLFAHRRRTWIEAGLVLQEKVKEFSFLLAWSTSQLLAPTHALVHVTQVGGFRLSDYPPPQGS